MSLKPTLTKDEPEKLLLRDLPEAYARLRNQYLLEFKPDKRDALLESSKLFSYLNRVNEHARIVRATLENLAMEMPSAYGESEENLHEKDEANAKTFIKSLVNMTGRSVYTPKRIAQPMIKLNINEKTLAIFLNVSPYTMRLWLKGKAAPCNPSRRILQSLELDPAWYSHLTYARSGRSFRITK